MSINDNKKALVGAGLGLTLGAGAVLTLRPGLRKMLRHSINSIGKGGSRAVAAKGAIPKNVVKDARSIRKAIQQAGVDPRKVRVGIIATPGTGKSTMARALEAELGIKSISMDSAKSSPISGKRAKNFIDTQLNGKIPKGSILEQTHMPHSVDMDQFDVVIKLERDVDSIINSIKKRGKGAHQADYINYNNLQGEINESFNSLSGSHLNTRKGVDIKIRGKSGFKSEQGRLNRAKQLGLDIRKFRSLTQAQQLASLQAGKIIKPIGVTNSFKRGKIMLDTSLVGGSLVGGAIYGHHMDKKASMNRDQKKKIAIGAGLGLGAAAAITLARRPGLRAHLGAKFNTMFSSGNEKALAKLNIKGDIPKQSIQHARRMINDLKRQGYSLNQIKKMKIGVVGSTGSGKSSLARAIEQELGVARMSLDDYVSYMPFKSGNVDVQKAIKSEGGLKGGTVVEQSQLLHSGDPSQFDVIMKIERPVKDIKKGLLERGHAAVTHDYVDLTKAQTTVNEAFGTIGGHKRNLGSGLEMVVNPKGGDQATRMRLDRARDLGLDLDKFKGLSQRDQIQSLANKSIKSNQSFRAHISSGALGQDITIGGGLALGGGATGAFMSKESSRHRINAIMAQIDQHNLEKNAFAGTAAALAGGALVGGSVGALAGGEGNRIGGAITGALTGAGLAYGGKQLMGRAGKLVSGGATGGTRANVIANSALPKGVKVTDDVLMRDGVIMLGPKGQPLTSSALNKLKVDAASQPQVARYLKSQNLIGENAVKTTTLGQHVKHTDDIANALKSGNPEAAFDRAVKAGFMSEGEAAKQLQYVNPARLEAYQASQAANRQAVAMAGGGSAPVGQATSAPVVAPNQSYVPQPQQLNINRGRAPSSNATPPPIPQQAMATPPPIPQASRNATAMYQSPQASRNTTAMYHTPVNRNVTAVTPPPIPQQASSNVAKIGPNPINQGRVPSSNASPQPKVNVQPTDAVLFNTSNISPTGAKLAPPIPRRDLTGQIYVNNLGYGQLSAQSALAPNVGPSSTLVTSPF